MISQEEVKGRIRAALKREKLSVVELIETIAKSPTPRDVQLAVWDMMDNGEINVEFDSGDSRKLTLN